MKKYFILLFSLIFATNLCAENTPSAFLAGEVPASQPIEKVLSAGNPSDVLLLSVAPQKIVGLAGFNMASQGGKLFPAEQQALPTIGKIAGKGSTLSAEKIVALQPNLIIDVGNVTPNYIDQAKRTFAQTGVPYLLLDGRLSATPNTLRELGKWLGVEQLTEQQAQYAEETLKSAVDFSGVLQQSAYLARSADGLQTGQKGSIHTETMELVGLRNVVEGEHKGLTQVSMEQLLLWNPDIILTQYAEFFQTIKNNPVDMAFLVKTDSKDEQDKIAKKIEKELENLKSDKILDASIYKINMIDHKHAELVIEIKFASGERARKYAIEKFDEIWYLKNPL